MRKLDIDLVNHTIIGKYFDTFIAAYRGQNIKAFNYKKDAVQYVKTLGGYTTRDIMCINITRLGWPVYFVGKKQFQSDYAGDMEFAVYEFPTEIIHEENFYKKRYVLKVYVPKQAIEAQKGKGRQL